MSEPVGTTEITIQPEGITQERPIGRDWLTLTLPLSDKPGAEWSRCFQSARPGRAGPPQPTRIWGQALHVQHVANDPQAIRAAVAATREDVRRANAAYRDLVRQYEAASTAASRQAEADQARAQAAIEQVKRDWEPEPLPTA